MKIFVLLLMCCLSSSISMPSLTIENTNLDQINFPVIESNTMSSKSLSAVPCISTEANFYISKAKSLLQWNKEKLRSQSDLNINNIKELFAPEFVVIANGRKYDANYQNYYEFLNKFRSDIETIDYDVQEYLNMQSTVVMPLKATVKRLNGNVDIFNAIMLIKFNDLGKIIHWQEVYSLETKKFTA